MSMRLVVGVVVGLTLVVAVAEAAECTKCGKQLKWGFGTCAECKQAALEKVKSGFDGSVNYCEECGKQLKWGVGTCAECKRAQVEALAQRAERATKHTLDRAARGLGDTVGQGVAAYEEARKPEWQRLLESPAGLAVIGGAGGILFVAVVVRLVRPPAPRR